MSNQTPVKAYYAPAGRSNFKKIICLFSSFADWLNNQIIRNQLIFDIKVCLIKNGDPPQYSSEIFRKAMRFGQGALLESKNQAKVIQNAARYLTGAAQGGIGGANSYDNRKTYNQNASTTIQVDKLVVRDEQDVRSLAIEIAGLTKRQQRGKGMRFA